MLHTHVCKDVYRAKAPKAINPVSTPTVGSLNETPAQQPLMSSPDTICIGFCRECAQHKLAFSVSLKNLMQDFICSEFVWMAAALGSPDSPCQSIHACVVHQSKTSPAIARRAPFVLWTEQASRSELM